MTEAGRAKTAVLSLPTYPLYIKGKHNAVSTTPAVSATQEEDRARRYQEEKNARDEAGEQN